MQLLEQEMAVFSFAVPCYLLHFSHARLIEKVEFQKAVNPSLPHRTSVRIRQPIFRIGVLVRVA